LFGSLGAFGAVAGQKNTVCVLHKSPLKEKRRPRNDGRRYFTT
jgi:hypothetical protein